VGDPVSKTRCGVQRVAGDGIIGMKDAFDRAWADRSAMSGSLRKLQAERGLAPS
jgi:hypothetical protein